MDGLVLGRELLPDDVETAHRLLSQHQPLEERRDGKTRVVCANALHTYTAPAYPCDRVKWAERVLAAEDRGEIENSNLRDFQARRGVA